MHPFAMRLAISLAAALPLALTAVRTPASYAAPQTLYRSAVAPACAAVGTYTVGPRGLGILSQPKSPQLGGSAAVYPYPYPYATGVLTGTVTLASYSACGVPTAGTFAVHALLLPPYPYPTPPHTNGSAGGVIAQPAIFGTTVLTATGTFAQDPAHSKDPGYVSVGGTVTYGRYGYNYGCAPICDQPRGHGTIICPQGGCGQPGKPVVSRVVTFTGITGYLRLHAGPPAALALLFLPPPEPVATVSSIQPVSLYGVRLAP